MKKQSKFLLSLSIINVTNICFAMLPTRTFIAEPMASTFTGYYPKSDYGTCIPNTYQIKGTCECIQDPNTGYVWTANAYNIRYGEKNSKADELNKGNLCGLKTGWTLPTKDQMLEVTHNLYRINNPSPSTLEYLFNNNGFIGISDEASYWLQDNGLKWQLGVMVRLPVPHSETAESSLNSSDGVALFVNTSSTLINGNL